jgi:ElaB/YqjD/DUF883 family membrane-anchored ribosome-binding protein
LSGASKDKIVGTNSDPTSSKINKETSSKKQRQDITSSIKDISSPASQSFSQSFSQAESQSNNQKSPFNKKSFHKLNKWRKKVQQQSNKAAYNKRAPMNNSNEYVQQKQFFRRQGPSNFKRSTFKPQGEVDPYSPDLRL